MTMHVMHLTSVHPRHDTRIFLKECASLVRAGYRVTLLVADGKGNEVTDSGVGIIDMGKAHSNRLLRMLFTPWRLFWAARVGHPSIIHIHDPELIPAAMFATFLGKRVIFDMHENVPKQILDKYWLPRFGRKALSLAYSVLERLALNRFSVVFAENSYEEDYSWIDRRTTVLNLPDTGLLPTVRPGEKYPVFTIGYIGGCTPERGVLTVSSAIKMLRERGTDVRFVCIGPQNTAVSTDPIFKAGITEGWIDAPGRLSGEAGWQRISRCHAGIAALHPIPNYTRSWPTKMFEYMAMGLPVIASDFALYRDVIEPADCGLCVDPLEPEAIARAINHLMSDPDISRHMGENGRLAIADGYNWRFEEAKLISFYEVTLSDIKSARHSRYVP